MNCKKANKLINKYIDGELNESLVKEFQKHILSCKECKSAYESYVLLKNELKELSDTPLPSGFETSLHLKLAKAAQEKRVFGYRPLLNGLTAVAVAFALLFGISNYREAEVTTDELTGNIVEEQKNIPMMVAEIEADTDAVSYDYMRKSVMFAEYELALSDNPDLVKKLAEIVEINDNIIYCDDMQFNLIFEILSENNINLEFCSYRDGSNLIVIK